MVSRTTLLLGGAIAAVLAVAAIAASATSSIQANAAQDRDRQEIEEIVRSYLLENPEVIFEAVERYQAREQIAQTAAAEDAIREALPELLSASSGHAIGADADAAEILVVEFFDYHCGYCRQAMEFTLALPEENDGVRVVLMELPVIHPRSRDVALAALAVEDTADYIRLHRELMQATGLITEERLPQLAKAAKIAPATLDAALAESESRDRLEAKLDRSTELAVSFGIDGTPGFIVATPDGSFVELIPGFAPDRVQAAIERARQS
jgi:protein-disulfide isomerase